MPPAAAAAMAMEIVMGVAAVPQPMETLVAASEAAEGRWGAMVVGCHNGRVTPARARAAKGVMAMEEMAMGLG